MTAGILQYGDYHFEPNSTYFTIHQMAEQSSVGRTMEMNHQWVIEGRITGNSLSTVDAKAVALRAALVNGYDLSFNLGSYSLTNAQCVDGVKILHFSWLRGFDGAHGSGAECILRRTFRVIIGGKIPVTSDTDVIEWHETFRGIGNGGPSIKPVRSLTGAVQAQQTEAITEYWAMQSGWGVGLLGYPTPASALWLAIPGVYYVPEKMIVTNHSPKYGPNINTRFRTEWSYTCWSTIPLVASPSGF